MLLTDVVFLQQDPVEEAVAADFPSLRLGCVPGWHLVRHTCVRVCVRIFTLGWGSARTRP